MGNCVGTNHNSTLKKNFDKLRARLSEQQIQILHLIYKDLSDRIVDRMINLQNFLLFFHKNGYWGDRLFKQFDYTETNLIEEHEFISGVANIFKSSEREKISLLFKFLSTTRDNNYGVFFSQFLRMLYNYPKEDLKEILNDKDFIDLELKKHLIPVDNRSDYPSSVQILEPTKTLKHYLSIDFGQDEPQGAGGEEKKEQKEHVYQISNKRGEETYPSILGNDILNRIKHKETVIRLNDGDNTFDIKTINIQQIVKKFAHQIFREANIDQQTGRLNFEQFYNWISIHKALYENYFNSCHSVVWQTDEMTHKPKYLTIPCQIKSLAKIAVEKGIISVQIYLRHSILIVCQQKQLEMPIMIICLQGLAVNRIYEPTYGFGIKISHRDGVYEDKKIFFKNQKLLLQWMECLKFYKGDSLQQRYQIHQKIGAGKFSIVYKCYNIQQKQDYALKEIATFKLEEQARNLIAHETSIMQVISHPLLLKLKECFQTKTHIYIITEYVNGKDLFQVVKQRQYLEEYDAAKITQQIMIGIIFLHSLEIVHRDLKPENIMVMEDEASGQFSCIKIIDFGFSNYLSKLLQRPVVQLMSGTPNYIAPEILRQQEINFKIDNFAIGVILYFMLTGGLPFNDYTIADILKNTMVGIYTFPQNISISQNAQNLIAKLLQNSPKDRITLNEAIRHPWFDILKSPRIQSERKHIFKKLSQ